MCEHSSDIMSQAQIIERGESHKKTIFSIIGYGKPLFGTRFSGGSTQYIVIWTF